MHHTREVYTVVPIPFIYVEIAAGHVHQEQIFKGYVIGYLKRSHPELQLIKIKKLFAICKKKTN